MREFWSKRFFSGFAMAGLDDLVASSSTNRNVILGRHTDFRRYPESTSMLEMELDNEVMALAQRWAHKCELRRASTDEERKQYLTTSSKSCTRYNGAALPVQGTGNADSVGADFEFRLLIIVGALHFEIRVVEI